MKDTRHLSIIVAAFFISLLSLFYITQGIHILVYTISIAISVVAFPLVNTNISFLLMLIEILGIGFYNTFTVFSFNLSKINQFSAILEITLFIVCIATLWLIFHMLKGLKEEQVELKNRVEQLKKYESNIEIFTKYEFLSIAKFIYTGMKRRKEKGFLLTLIVNKDNHHVQESVFHSLAKIILDSVRTNYDLVGKLSDDSIIILLQNTDESGCNTVIQRFENNLGKILNLEKKPYLIEIQELNDEIYSNLSKEGLFA